MLTKPITYASWITETTVGGTFFGEKTRSGLLLAVDQALRTYENATPKNKLTGLHRLCDSYDAWYADKTRKNPDGPLKSIRNADDQLQVFEQWLHEEEVRLLPAVEPGWGHGPNCYAYAMKCKAPAGNGMAPGIAAGEGATLKGIGRDLVQYTRRLFDGIKRDAAADGNKTVSFFPQGVENSDDRPDPIQMPKVVPDRQYLVAMLVTAGGFHFMRRDSRTNLWSHKNRSDGAPEATAEHLGPAGRLGRRSSPITDDVAVELARNQFPGVNVEPFGGGYFFAGYILVPEEGIVVRGVTGTFN